MTKKIFTTIYLAFATLLIRAQEINVLHYKFIITLSNNNDTLNGRAEVRFVKQTNDSMIKLDLVSLNEQGKGMKIVTVGVDKKNAPGVAYSHKNNTLFINTSSVKKGDSASVLIVYKGIPSDGLIISKNKYGDRTFFADNWPNRAHNWIPCVDRPDDKASFEFYVIAPTEYKVISNGIKKAEQVSELAGFTETHWKEDTPLPTKVMVIGVAKFATKTFDDSPPNIPVSAWVYPQDSTKGFYDYALATDILKFVSNYIAPYPYKKLANVQSKTIFGGMENASAIFYAENSVTGDRSSEDLLAHEIAHQWFGDMASEKSFAHLWLSEGFATYFTNLYVEHKYGREAMNKRLQKEREEVIAFSKQTTHAVVDSTSDLMSLLNANSYQKGAWVLHMLRNEVGDTVFQKIIQAYYNQYKGSNADTRDLEAVAEKISGKNLKWFFDQWLYQPGIPQLDFTFRKQDHKIILTITQKQKRMYLLPLKIGYVVDLGRILKFKKVMLNGPVTHVELPANTEKIYTGTTEILCEAPQVLTTK